MRFNSAIVALGLLASSLAVGESMGISSLSEPVTETVTVTLCPSMPQVSSPIVVGNSPSTSGTASLATITSFSTLTNYVTVVSSVTSESLSAAVSSSGSDEYSYVDHDGTTSWLGGKSPASTYSSFVTRTVELTISPIPFESVISDVTVFKTKIITITPPAVTTTELQSFVSSTGVSGEPTTTSTVTNYLTKTIVSIQTVHVSSVGTVSSDSISSSKVLTDNYSATTTISVLNPLSSDSTTTTISVLNPLSSDSTTTTISVLNPLSSDSATTTISVQDPLSSDSACSVSFVDVTTDLTYTVFATPSAGLSSAINSSIMSGAGATPATWNITNYSFSRHSNSGAKSLSNIVSQITATASYITLQPSSLSSMHKSSGFVPLIPTPAISVTLSPSTLRASSTLTKKYTNISTSATPSPSVCGEHGDFTLTWEDEPNFVPTDPITDPTDAPPVFSPYHHLYFSDGFVSMPPPSTPFEAISSPRLVMFLANQTGEDSNNHGDGNQLAGEIGAGQRRSSDAFWFNAYSAYLGCDNEGPDDCIMQISGLVLQNSTKQEVTAYQQNFTLTACPGLTDCHLQRIDFPNIMRGLSGIRIEAFVGSERRSWFMDDLSLGWYNNSCAAGMLRIRSH